MDRRGKNRCGERSKGEGAEGELDVEGPRGEKGHNLTSMGTPVNVGWTGRASERERRERGRAIERDLRRREG